MTDWSINDCWAIQELKKVFATNQHVESNVLYRSNVRRIRSWTYVFRYERKLENLRSAMGRGGWK